MGHWINGIPQFTPTIQEAHIFRNLYYLQNSAQPHLSIFQEQKWITNIIQ